jgi:putative molybdopterin biosynthesis protein
MQYERHAYFTTDEVADYLRLAERTIYELARTRRIPCARITGKLLFPRHLIDLWAGRQTDFEGLELERAPPVLAGSHDPLLDWAMRESGSDLALLAGGSEDGLRRLAVKEAVVAAMHIIDSASGTYNVAAIQAMHGLADVVLIEWAKREQGLILPRGNPAGVTGIKDLAAKRLRIMRRQAGAGTQTLLRHLVSREGLDLDTLSMVETPAPTETDLASAIFDGKADCGLAVRAVAGRFHLDFIPLHWERFDLALRRRDYFEAPIQRMLRFARSAGFREHAEELGGYDLGGHGEVIYNS